jgi:hypothetical protein
LRPTVACGVRNETCCTAPRTAAATPAYVAVCAGATLTPTASADAALRTVSGTEGRLRFINPSTLLSAFRLFVRAP